MSRATVDREIARLEAIGRTRVLTEGESRQLQAFVRTEQRYDRMAEANRAARARA